MRDFFFHGERSVVWQSDLARELNENVLRYMFRTVVATKTPDHDHTKNPRIRKGVPRLDPYDCTSS
eukprot:233331-Amphidinium_carterae.1